MASIQKMNETIYSYLFGEEQGNNSNFHEDYNLLMKAMEKAMGHPKKLNGVTWENCSFGLLYILKEKY